MEETKKRRSYTHIFMVVSYIVGYPILAVMFYWTGQVWWGHAAIGLWLTCLTAYWFYGIDYYKVDWLLNFKYGKNHASNSST